MDSSRSPEVDVAGDGEGERQSFYEFFEEWIREQDVHLRELTAAADENKVGHEEVRPLVEKVVRHYEHYYRTKRKLGEKDALLMLSPTWTSSLEDAFLWIGGWRPSMSFNLLYSKAAMQLDSEDAGVADLAGLSADQFVRVDEMQRRTVREERVISEKWAKQQEKAAGPGMVKLSHETTMAINNSENPPPETVDSALKMTRVGFREVLKRADELRLRTVKELIEILTPFQAVHFLAAAAELHLRLHDWGKTRLTRPGAPVRS